MDSDGRTGTLDLIRQPEYTGDNRCWPCTIVNILITGLLAAAVALVTPVGAMVVAILGITAIVLRGYLVPGTPTLTQRYLPRSILRLFDKDPAESYALPDDDDLAVALKLRSRRGDDAGEDEPK